MSMLRTSLRALRRYGAGLAAVALLASPLAHADTDYSDIWWEGPGLGGWGVNMAQNDSLIYITFFVYDAAGKATWFGGTMSRVANGVYSGTLYTVIKGDFYGNDPFNPTLSQFAAAGSMSFTASDPSHGQLSYTVDSAHSGTGAPAGRTVGIQRQSLQMLDVSGNFMGAEQYSLTGSGCGSGASPQTFFDQIVITQTVVSTSAMTSTVNIGIYDEQGNPVCSTKGTATQTGKTLEIPSGITTCPGGSSSTSARVYDMRIAADAGIEYRWTNTVDGCVIEGRVNALNSTKAR
ncbi:MAG: hypothetical protein JSR18_05130 [Proteobacteria bacterium]|nr:hypothetical protein [Pseudomonadota bacterium]